jgi:hypothetical protein
MAGSAEGGGVMEQESEPGGDGRPDGRTGRPDQDAAAETRPPDGAGAGTGVGTGEPRVDAALRLLDRLPGLPVSDHPELFEQVHAQLTEVLGELDSGLAGSGPQGN